ncbi:MAG: terminase small subunit [Anaerolineaceae bacterium]|nr:terminase small subunit [Anaerolineaceae bacterium]
MSLTPKQRSFIEFYLQSWNSREAAEKAGYGAPGKAGYRLLSNPEVAELIAERLKELSASAAEVIVRLTNQARAKLGDFLELDDDGKASINWTKVLLDSDAVKKITYNRQGKPMLELYDKQRALEILGRYARLDAGDASHTEQRVEDLSAVVDLIAKAKDQESFDAA